MRAQAIPIGKGSLSLVLLCGLAACERGDSSGDSPGDDGGGADVGEVVDTDAVDAEGASETSADADGAVDAVQVYALDKGRINGLVDDASQVDITGTVVTVTDVRADYDANITATTGNVNLHADAIHAGNTINMYAGDSVQDIDNNGTINAVAIAGPINITVGTGVIGVPGNPVELNAGQGLTLTSLDPAGVGPFWAVVDGTFGGPVDYAGVGNTPPGVIFVNGNTFGGPSDLLNAIALAQNPAIGATPLTFGALMGALVPSDSVSLLNTFFLHATVVLNEFRTMPMNQYFAFGSGWVDGLPSGIGPGTGSLPAATRAASSEVSLARRRAPAKQVKHFPSRILDSTCMPAYVLFSNNRTGVPIG